jgi:hypothetical protein
MYDILKKYVSFVGKTPKENVIWGIHAQSGGVGGALHSGWMKKCSCLGVRYELNTPYVETVPQIFMKFSVDVLYRKLSCKHVFRTNRRSES